MYKFDVNKSKCYHNFVKTVVKPGYTSGYHFDYVNIALKEHKGRSLAYSPYILFETEQDALVFRMKFD